MTWRTARSLDTLLAEINRAAPYRSVKSDGSIGDQAHSARTSDHNPNRSGVVRARDFTHNPAGGLDCNVLAARLVLLLGRHPALGSGAYIIWDGRIISTDRLNEGWRDYDGNPHSHHLHLSVAKAAGGYDSTVPWGVMGSIVRRLPKRVRRYLAETKLEITRLRAARASASNRGEPVEPYSLAIKRQRAARRAAREAAKR